MAIFGRFWLFLALFWQFFNAKIARSQNKGNSYYKNLENNIPLDFVIGIFPILSSWDATSKKLPKNRPKMAKISQKCTFWVKKIFFRPKIETYESYFCKHPPEVRFGRFLRLWDHLSKSLSVFRFFHLFKKSAFFGANRQVPGLRKTFQPKTSVFLKILLLEHMWTKFGP